MLLLHYIDNNVIKKENAHFNCLRNYTHQENLLFFLCDKSLIFHNNLVDFREILLIILCRNMPPYVSAFIYLYSAETFN